MKVLLVQLSDIHIESEDDPVLSRADAIASAIAGADYDSDVCLLAISGDLAHSGTADQYVICDVFVTGVVERLQAQSCTRMIKGDLGFARTAFDSKRNRSVPEQRGATALPSELGAHDGVGWQGIDRGRRESQPLRQPEVPTAAPREGRLLRTVGKALARCGRHRPRYQTAACLVLS